MLQKNNNEYINKNIYPLSVSKTEIILSLITEIYKLKEKITEIKNSSTQEKILENKTKIEKIKQAKEEMNKEINELSMNLLLELSNKNNIIKKKQYSIKEISKKINNYKNILKTYDNLAFNSPVIKNYLIANNFKQFLSDEQIDDILSKTQNITKNDNLIHKTQKEFVEKKDELKIAEEEKRKILEKISEIKESLKMLKEEKIVINNELVNYISLKETLESIIKSNLMSLLSNTNLKSNEDIKEEINLERNVFINNREKYSRNRSNKIINNIHEENDNNEFSYLKNNSDNYENKKIYEKLLTLYKFELYNLDSNKISNEICNDIIDVINSKLNYKDINNNMGKSIALENNKSIKMLEKGNSQKINDRYSSFNPQTFSCDSPIIKRTKSNIVISNTHLMVEFKKEIQNKLKDEIKNLIKNINQNIVYASNSNEYISNAIINIINDKGYKLNKNNLKIYISCILKKSFYEYQITSKIKFMNKDYKNIKKSKKKIYDKLQDQLTKLNSKIESINNTIILQANKLKILNNNKENKKNIVDKNEVNNLNGNINLSLEEQNYIQLCRKANSFINEKNEIEKEIEMLENDKKLEKYQGELKIKNMKNELNDLNKKIIISENEILQGKRKIEQNISQIKGEIDIKYNIIKENLIIYKKECFNNNKQNEYNEFIDRLNNSIENDYYKTLFNLEKFYKKDIKQETNTSNENLNINNNILKINKSFNFNSYRGNAHNMKLFYYGNNYCSSINNTNKNDDIYNNKKLPKENIGQPSNSNNIFQNRIKNNYINIFDSYNNLNNFFFQFQSPSAHVYFDKQNNKLETNNIINQGKPNTKVINNISNSSPFSSASKNSSSKKRSFSPSNNNDIKPKNLIYNLRYLSTDKMKTKNSNKMNNINELKLIQNNTINIYKNESEKNNKIKKESKMYQSFSPKINKKKNIINFISKNNININLEQTNSKNEKIFCYFRILTKNKKEKEFNPLLEDVSLLNKCQFPYNFIKSTINIDKFHKKIKIFPSNQIEPIEINGDKIDNYQINTFMNKILSVYTSYKNFKIENGDKDDINLFIKKIRKNNSFNDMSDENIKKCCFNQKFSLELILTNKIITEFLFSSYEEYRNVKNNIKSLIKDKKETLYEIFNINKFEYPK